MNAIGVRRLEQAAELGHGLIAGLVDAGVLIVDPELRILAAEGEAYQAVARAGLVGRCVPDVIPAAAWRALEPRYRAALAGRAQAFTYDAVTEPTRHRMRMAPILNSGEVIGLMVIAEDATEEQRTADRLAESLRMRESVLDVLGEGILVIDSDRVLVQANPAAVAMLAIDLDEARADPDWWRGYRWRFADDGRSLDVGRGPLRTGRAYRDVDVLGELPDGTHVQWSANFQPLPAQEGRARRMVVSFRDVTEHVLAKQEAAAAHDFSQTTLDSLSAHIAVLDDQGRVIMTNRAWVEFGAADGAGPAGLGDDYLAACDAATDDPDSKRVSGGLRSIIAGEQTDFTLEYRCHGSAGEAWYMLSAVRYEGPGNACVVVSRQDITDRHRAQQEVVTQAALLDELGVAVVATGLNHIVSVWSRGAEELYGYTAEEMLGADAVAVLSPMGSDHIDGYVADVERAGMSASEFMLRRKDGSTFPASVHGRLLADGQGTPYGRINVSVDVSERVAAERALLHARNYMRAVADSMGEGLFTLDVEGRLIYMNPAAQTMLGWPLEEVEGRMLHEVVHLRRPDGSELPVEQSPIRQAQQKGETVRVEDALFIRMDGRELPVAYTCSPFETEDLIEGSVVVFEDISDRKETEGRLRREADKLAWIGRIQDALAEDRFVLYAQPIVNVESGAVVQSELLLRLREPGGEIVGPGAYLPIAEQYGLIGDIDRWVIEEGIRLAASGRPVEINLSAQSVGDQEILDHIEGCLASTGADPALIVFEITETAIVKDEGAARMFTERLHAIGCKIALDDFGTGYGGFTYLKQLPVDYLKIDIEFVRDLATNPASRHVVEAVVGLARGFGLHTVAEGVEDAEAYALLCEIGVDMAQGYHIARPGPIEQPTTGEQ